MKRLRVSILVPTKLITKAILIHIAVTDEKFKILKLTRVYIHIHWKGWEKVCLYQLYKIFEIAFLLSNHGQRLFSKNGGGKECAYQWCNLCVEDCFTPCCLKYLMNLG